MIEIDFQASARALQRLAETLESAVNAVLGLCAVLAVFQTWLHGPSGKAFIRMLRRLRVIERARQHARPISRSRLAAILRHLPNTIRIGGYHAAKV